MSTEHDHRFLNPDPGADEAGAPIKPGAEAPTPPRPPRFPSFDGLRAIAALMVVGVHATFASGLTPENPRGIGMFTARLDAGVAVFFLISGFLLFRPFTVSHFAQAESPGTRAFWIRRLLRIVPAYWLALFVSTTIFRNAEGMGPGGWKSYASHYLFLQIYSPTQVLYGLSVAWSLCVEVSFYFFIPLYAALIGRRRDRFTPRTMLMVELGGVVGLVTFSVIWRIVILYHLMGIGPSSDIALNWLPAYLDLFGLGMALAIISAWFHHNDREPAFFSNPLFPWVSWFLALVCFWAVSHLGFNVTDPFLSPKTPFPFIARQSLNGLFAFFLLLPAIFGPQSKGMVRRALRCWPMASLGVISYGIYLWHATFILEIIHWRHLRTFHIPTLKFLFVVLALTVIVSTVSYFALEKPVLRLRKYFTWFEGRPKPPIETKDASAGTR